MEGEVVSMTACGDYLFVAVKHLGITTVYRVSLNGVARAVDIPGLGEL